MMIEVNKERHGSRLIPQILIRWTQWSHAMLYILSVNMSEAISLVFRRKAQFKEHLSSEFPDQTGMASNSTS